MFTVYFFNFENVVLPLIYTSRTTLLAYIRHSVYSAITFAVAHLTKKNEPLLPAIPTELMAT